MGRIGKIAECSSPVADHPLTVQYAMAEHSFLTVFQLRRRLTSAYQHLMALHWSMSWSYLILFGTGLVMADLERGTPFRPELYKFHKGLGVLVSGLLLWRIGTLLRVW